ncbi:unnamed protein product [Parnassius apollo]|uniref:(apollo) hypothetical protein n=1 Tax=Parnassius apollo TaxID=110799 RepID=A0A8S3X750_PARAO|nr:unnamed protein product [Parnassius apollo]
MFHQRLKEGLPQFVKNREVLAIFNTQAQAEEEKLKNDLLAIRPVSPTNYCARFGSYQTLGTLRRSICNTQAGDGEPIEGPRCVHGPEAWLEGLRQKRWTLATILIVLLAAHRCDTTASLLGQGDNQVIVLRIPSQRYVQERKLTPDEYTKQFLRVLEDICTASGIVIKVPESWRFRRLLEYGRRYYLDGVQVSGALKKASRFTSEANQTIHTTNALIAGLFSSGTSVEGDDETPLPAYMMTVFEAARVLWKRHAEH